MRHEPSGFERDAKDAPKLIGADTFFRRRHERNRLEPLVYRDMARLKNGPNLHGKGLAALVALVGANAGALAFELADTINSAAMRADRTIRPNAGFNPLISRLLVMEMLGA